MKSVARREKKARVEVEVMIERGAKVRNGNEAETGRGKRAKAVNGNVAEAKNEDEVVLEVENVVSEADIEVPTPDQNLTVPSVERLGCLIASN